MYTEWKSRAHQMPVATENISTEYYKNTSQHSGSQQRQKFSKKPELLSTKAFATLLTGQVTTSFIKFSLDLGRIVLCNLHRSLHNWISTCSHEFCPWYKDSMPLSLQCWLTRNGHSGLHLSLIRLISTFILRATADYHYRLK